MNTNHLIQVREFNETAGANIPDSPTLNMSNLKEVLSQLHFVREEVDELAAGILARDLENVLKEIVDVEYVLNGLILKLGLQDLYEEAFQEVHRSNMSKFPSTELDVARGVGYFAGQSTPFSLKEVGFEGTSRTAFIRDSDGKIMKPPSYKEANIKRIFDSNVTLSSNT